MTSIVETLPNLREVPITIVPNIEHLPTLTIRTDTDVELWKQTTGYKDYGLFLRRLNESVVGVTLPYDDTPSSGAVTALLSVLDVLDGWVNEIPPLNTPQRFGNLAFRTWGKRLEEQAESLLQSNLPPAFHACIPHLLPYFHTSFGSFVRMDYGTGHETSFALFLMCLTLVRFLKPNPEEERQIVLRIFVRYLKLCWRLQDVYKLEPAGSHGVWGLDDSHFLGYIFGSAQLRDQTEIPPSAILRPSLPPTNLYFMSIMRIHEVKHGPFHEHSSQLHSIATGVMYWAKVNSGLFKMYEAEVLGKRVVVQHIPLGGLLKWDPSPSQTSTGFSTLPQTAAYSSTTIVPPPRSIESAIGVGNSPSLTPTGGTQAPWATAALRTGISDHGTSLASMMQPPGSIYRYGSDYGDWASNASNAGYSTQTTGTTVPTRVPWADTSVGTGMPSIPPLRTSGSGKRGGGPRRQGSKESQSTAPPPTVFPQGMADPGSGQQSSGPV